MCRLVNKPRTIMAGKLKYELETFALAKNYGYDSPFELMKVEYLAGKSSSQIGRMIDKTGPAVRNHLVRMGIKMRPRGGNNAVNGPKTSTRQFDITCNICGAKITAGAFYKLSIALKTHRCKL